LNGKPRPDLVVLLGHPVQHSLSPVFQNAAMRAAGIDARYETRDVPPGQLEGAVRELRRSGTPGNVTIPHKHAMLSLCDHLSATASRTGAVNTFVFRDGMLTGHNTDVAGFDRAARRLLDREPVQERVVLLGAGGAAAAVLAAVENWRDSTVRIVARNERRAKELSAAFPCVAGVQSGGDPAAAMAGATLLVNATPVGMTGDVMPVDAGLIPQGCSVLDLVYRRGETALVRAARARGLRAADGREMLLEQGALAFVQWFDVEPNKTMMRSALEQAMLRE
jgi:shikimate dehydrogenase